MASFLCLLVGKSKGNFVAVIEFTDLNRRMGGRAEKSEGGEGGACVKGWGSEGLELQYNC